MMDLMLVAPIRGSPDDHGDEPFADEIPGRMREERVVAHVVVDHKYMQNCQGFGDEEEGGTGGC